MAHLEQAPAWQESVPSQNNPSLQALPFASARSQVLVASLQVTVVVQVSPQLLVVELQLPNPLHAWMLQNGPVPPSAADAPHLVSFAMYE